MAVAVLGAYDSEGCQMPVPELNEEEHEWLPNPYQAEADAQVLAGAWPGMPVIMGMAQPDSTFAQQDEMWGFTGVPAANWPALDALPCNGALVGWDMEQRFGGEELIASEAAPADYFCWEASPWHCLMEFTPDSKSDSRGSLTTSTLAGTDEGDLDQDALEESAANTSGSEETSPTEGLECDGASTICDTVCSGVPPERRGGSGRYSRKLSHQCVPKRLDLGKSFAQDVEKDNITTLMVRNIPNMYTRSMLIEELNCLGFEGEYDFIYLPMDKSTQWNVGYAFVNFSSPSVAKRVIKEMTNYAFQCYEHGSGKVAQISIAHIQGLEKNSEYYSNTAVQCARIQTYRPLVLNSKQGAGAPPPQSESPEHFQRGRKTQRRRIRSQQTEEEFRGHYGGSSSNKQRSRRGWAQDRRGHAYTA